MRLQFYLTARLDRKSSEWSNKNEYDKNWQKNVDIKRPFEFFAGNKCLDTISQRDFVSVAILQRAEFIRSIRSQKKATYNTVYSFIYVGNSILEKNVVQVIISKVARHWIRKMSKDKATKKVSEYIRTTECKKCQMKKTTISMQQDVELFEYHAWAHIFMM